MTRIEVDKVCFSTILEALRGTLQDDTKVDYREVEKLEAKDAKRKEGLIARINP